MKQNHRSLQFAGWLMLIASLWALTAVGQTPRNARPQAPPPVPSQFSYLVTFPQPHTHLYEIIFNLGNVTAAPLDLSLPTWTPGSYLQREYARHVQDFAASDEAGNAL